MGTVAVLAVVSKSGVKKRVLQYTLHGRRRELGHGGYPSLGLADARIFALKCRRQVATGTDPIEGRQMESKKILVFSACAARYIRGHRHRWQNAKYARQWASTLETCARPVIGKKPVNAITTEDILQILSPIWTATTETGKRVQIRREHRVPLLDSARTVLETLPCIEGWSLVFPGSRNGRPLSNMDSLQPMRGLGYGVNSSRGNYVPHGFRSTFRDWPGEVSSFPREVAEMALAHAIENKVEAAYRRGDLFGKRRKMMQAWADYLERPRSSEKVVDDLTLSGRSLTTRTRSGCSSSLRFAPALSKL